MKRDLAVTVSAAALVALGGSVAGAVALTSSSHKPTPAVRQVDHQAATAATPTTQKASAVALTSRSVVVKSHTVVKPRRTAAKLRVESPTRIARVKEPAVTDPTTTEPTTDPVTSQPAPAPADTASGTETTIDLGPGTTDPGGVRRGPTQRPTLSPPSHSNPPQLPNPNSPSPTP